MSTEEPTNLRGVMTRRVGVSAEVGLGFNVKCTVGAPTGTTLIEKQGRTKGTVVGGLRRKETGEGEVLAEDVGEEGS